MNELRLRLPPPGILLVAHGTIASLDELPDFLLSIRRGRPPSPELLAEMHRRYALVGGSPLLTITQAQAHALAAATGLPVLVGMRLWRPTVETALVEAAQRGYRQLCVLPLAPFSVSVYHEAAARSLVAVGPQLAAPIELVKVAPWGSEPLLIQAHAEPIRAALARHPGASVLLTAHSLPLAVIRAGDRYALEVESAVQAIGQALSHPVELAYQSQGTEGSWLEPNVKAKLEEFAQQGVKEVIVAPIGFLSDQIETQYDLDIEAAGWAGELGLTLIRIPALNTAPALIETLAQVVQRALGAVGGH